MKTIGRILLGMLVLLCLLIITGLFLPRDRQFTYSAVIHAPPYLVFDHVNHLKKWEEWFPGAKGDPFRFAYLQGKTSGTGAIGCVEKKHILTGDSTIVISYSEPYRIIELDFDLLTHAKTSYHWSFEELSDSTRVCWNVNLYEMGVIERYIGLIMNRVVGQYLIQGLDSLRSICETIAAVHPGICSVIEIQELDARPALSLSDSCMKEELGKKLLSMYSELVIYSEIKGIPAESELFAIYNPATTDGIVRLEAGLMLNNDFPGEGKIKSTTTPSGKHVTAVFTGPYASIAIPYEIMERFIADNLLTMSGKRWEIYRIDPSGSLGKMEQETMINLPVQ